MKPKSNIKYVIKTDASEFDLQMTFNQMSMLLLTFPQIPNFSSKPYLEPISLSDRSQQNLLDALSDIKGLKNILRYIKLNPKQHLEEYRKKQSKIKDTNHMKIDKQLFIRPTQMVANGNKTFWMVKGLHEPIRVRLNLDSPTFILTFQSSFEDYSVLVAIERKCLTLYEIYENSIHLKDFDSVSIDKKFNCVDIKHIQYDGKNYVLIFGNEKQTKIDYFKCLVYEIKNMQLTFIKKATIANVEIYSPTILFESYQKKQAQKYCLITGGCYDSRSSHYYQGWQIDIHLLVTSWLTYPMQLTKEVRFDKKGNIILSGKAIKYNDFWYIFCTENQTINQLKLNYHHGIQLQSIQISTSSLELKEKIYFSESNVFLVLKGALKLIMLSKALEFRQKDFLQIIERFDTY